MSETNPKPSETSGLTLAAVAAIKEPPVPETIRTDVDTEELVVQAEYEIRIEHLNGLKQDRAERKDYAWRVYVLICIWLIAIAEILFLNGFQYFGFHLEARVLMALIGGTTASVLGLFYIVAQYLFPKR